MYHDHYMVRLLLKLCWGQMKPCVVTCGPSLHTGSSSSFNPN